MTNTAVSIQKLMAEHSARLHQLQHNAIKEGDLDAADHYSDLLDEFHRSTVRADLTRQTREILTASTDPMVRLQAIETIAKLEGLY